MQLSGPGTNLPISVCQPVSSPAHVNDIVVGESPCFNMYLQLCVHSERDEYMSVIGSFLLAVNIKWRPAGQLRPFKLFMWPPSDPKRKSFVS